jgi:hypothetical protein
VIGYLRSEIVKFSVRIHYLMLFYQSTIYNLC